MLHDPVYRQPYAPKDRTIRETFNTYRCADYKVIDLLRRVTRVCVETMAIVDAMRAAQR